jgi:hypothetical protein
MATGVSVWAKDGSAKVMLPAKTTAVADSRKLFFIVSFLQFVFGGQKRLRR